MTSVISGGRAGRSGPIARGGAGRASGRRAAAPSALSLRLSGFAPGGPARSSAPSPTDRTGSMDRAGSGWFGAVRRPIGAVESVDRLAAGPFGAAGADLRRHLVPRTWWPIGVTRARHVRAADHAGPALVQVDSDDRSCRSGETWRSALAERSTTSRAVQRPSTSAARASRGLDPHASDQSLDFGQLMRRHAQLSQAQAQEEHCVKRLATHRAADTDLDPMALRPPRPPWRSSGARPDRRRSTGRRRFRWSGPQPACTESDRWFRLRRNPPPSPVDRP